MKQTLKHSFSFQMLEEQNVKFHMNDALAEIKGENGEVASVSISLFNGRHQDLSIQEKHS